MVSQPGAAETPAPLAGRIDPPWGGQASGFVQAEVGSSRRVGGCANPPCSNQNTPAPFLAVSADTRASAAERVCRWGAVAGACVCVLCARARVCVCVCVCVCVGSVAASAAADGKALSTYKSKTAGCSGPPWRASFSTARRQSGHTQSGRCSTLLPLGAMDRASLLVVFTPLSTLLLPRP